MKSLSAVWELVRERRYVVGLVVVLLLVGTPFMVSVLKDRSIRNDGEIVAAQVSEFEVRGSREDPEYWITYRLPPQFDDDTDRTLQVTEAAFRRADLRDSIRVQVLADDPEDHHVEGAVDSDTLGWVTFLLELGVLGAFAWMLWSTRRRHQVSERARSETDQAAARDMLAFMEGRTPDGAAPDAAAAPPTDDPTEDDSR